MKPSSFEKCVLTMALGFTVLASPAQAGLQLTIEDLNKQYAYASDETDANLAKARALVSSGDRQSYCAALMATLESHGRKLDALQKINAMIKDRSDISAEAKKEIADLGTTAADGQDELKALIRDKIIGTYAHPERGFEEAVPRTLPLKANPHMHMFEACLAWMEAGGDDTWRATAAMIADLCLDKFLDPKSGGLREFFDGDWNVYPGDAGRIFEPGHQFEWAWLFLRWADKTGDTRYAKAAHRLMDLGEIAGTDPKRDVTFNEMWDDLTPKDLNARLWPQTERIKAWVRAAEMALTPADKEAAMAKAIQAAAGLKLYLSTDIVGLWRDSMKIDGTFEVEPAPASSLYHIICAIDELSRLRL